MLDMNQDGYYSEGSKLPLVLPQFTARSQLKVKVDEDEKADAKRDRKGNRKGNRRNTKHIQMLIGEDMYGCIGFKEHIVTAYHSAVGRLSIHYSTCGSPKKKMHLPEDTLLCEYCSLPEVYQVFSSYSKYSAKVDIASLLLNAKKKKKRKEKKRCPFAEVIVLCIEWC